MSLNGLNNTVFPLTIDGTTSLDVSSLTIDGTNIDIAGLVPYTGATQTLDMGAQNIQTSHTPTAPNDVINLTTLQSAVTYVDTSVALTYLNKITTSSQTVAGQVTFNKPVIIDDSLTVNPTKTANLASVVDVSPNYKRAETDADVTANYRFGSISNAGGIYTATTTGDFATLGLANLTADKLYKINLYVRAFPTATYNTSIQLYSSADGTNPAYSLNYSASYTPASPNTFQLITGNFTVTTGYTKLILLCLNTNNPSYVTPVEWYGLELFDMGVALTNASMPSQTADRVLVLNTNKQVVASGINTTKLGYLDNVSSDIQTQLNAKLNLSGSNANQNIVIGSYKVQSSATPSTGDDYVNKTYADGLISGLSSIYLPLAGGTMTGNITMNGNKITSTYTPINADDLTRKGYVDTQDGLRVLKAGDTMTATLYNSGGDFHAYRGGDTNRGCILTANNADGATYASNNGGLASWNGISFKSTYDNTTRFVFNTRDGNSSQTGTLTANGVIIDGQTASRVCVLDGSKNVVSSTVTSTTLSYLDIGSSLTSLLNAKGNLSGGNTWSGDQTFNSGVITISTRLLGEPDAPTDGNFWMGLRGSASEVDRLAISIVGNQTTGLVSRVSIPKVLRLTQPTANRVLTLDTNGDVVSSTVTPTVLGYLDIGSSLTGLLNGKLNDTGDTATGIIRVSIANTYAQRASNPLPSNFVADSSSQRLYMGSYYTGGVGACSTIQASDYYSSADHGNSLLINPLGGSVGFNQSSPQYLIHASLTNGWDSSVGGYDTNKARGIIALGGKNDDPDYQYLLFPNPSKTDGSIAGMAWWSSDMIVGRYKNEFRLAWWKDTHGSPLGTAYKEGITLFLTDSSGYTTLDWIKMTGKVGIGTTTSPSHLLHVEGTSYLNGDTTISGNVGIGTANKTGVGLKFPDTIQSRRIVLYDGGYTDDHRFYGFGINANTLRFNIPNASADRFSFFAGAGSSGATSAEVFRINGTGGMESGVSGASPNTTANLKMASSACHIDNNAGEVYLFTGFNGHIGIQRNTTRNATTACLALGTSSTEESQVISVKADNSDYMPLSFASSKYTFTQGTTYFTNKVGILEATPTAPLHVKASGGGNPNANGVYIYNTNNTANEDAILSVRTAGSSGGNPYISFDVAADAGWSWGMDNADNYMKLSYSWASLTSATRWTVKTGGEFGINCVPDYPIDVNGSGRVRGNLYVGTEGTNGATIFMGGPTGDTGYDHCQMKCRTYNSTYEGSELVLFKGNDPYSSPGLYPDRIRLRANALAFDTHSGYSTDPDAESIRMVLDQNGRLGLGNLQLVPDVPDNGLLNINRSPARTGTHGTGLALYVTNGGNAIAEFRDPNGSQGIGFGYNRIYATGSNTDQNLELYARAGGELRHEARTHKWYANGSGLSPATMELLSDGMLQVSNAVSIIGNTTTTNANEFRLRTNGPVFVAGNAWGYGTGGNGVLQVGAIQSSDFSGRAQDSISCRAWNDGNYIISFHNTSGTIRGQIAGVNSSSVAYQTSSDRRLKDNVHHIEGSLNIINRLQPVHFRWIKDDEYDFGFIAQDVYKVLPHMRPNLTNYIKECSCKREEICNGKQCEHCQTMNDEPVDEEGNPRYYSLDYGRFTPYLVGAVQEQQKQIEHLNARVKVLEAREAVWVEHAREQEAKQKKMEERMEKMASLISQLMKA